MQRLCDKPNLAQSSGTPKIIYQIAIRGTESLHCVPFSGCWILDVASFAYSMRSQQLWVSNGLYLTLLLRFGYHSNMSTELTHPVSHFNTEEPSPTLHSAELKLERTHTQGPLPQVNDCLSTNTASSGLTSALRMPCVWNTVMTTPCTACGRLLKLALLPMIGHSTKAAGA